MPSRRFRRLELDGAPASDGLPQGPTDICRRCGAEHPEGTAKCGRCGGVLGGEGQDAFDAAHRARRAAKEADAVRARAAGQHKEVSDAPAPRSAAPQPAAGRESELAGLLSAGILLACIFALVSIPVRLVFAAAARQEAPLLGFVEIGIVVVVTILVKRAAGRMLAGR